MSQTCDYMDMQYKGCLYFYIGEDAGLAKDNELSVEKFSSQVFDPKINHQDKEKK